jgi:ribonuclease BN (tRNA processing enzyme)
VLSRLVVLGSCGAWPEPGRACSGFLLEHQGFRVVLDLGYDTFSRLAQRVQSTVADGVDAVVVTHSHPDHMVDLHALFRARWFGRRRAASVPVFAADGVIERLRGLEDGDADDIAAVFDVYPLPADPYDVGPFTLSSWLLPHFVPNAGVRLSSASLTVSYTGDTGDTGPDPTLALLGRDADLFIVEASDRNQGASAQPAADGVSLHMSGRDAGQAASAANAHRLMLTHFWPDSDREETRRAAEAVYAGEVIVATEDLEVSLP